MFASFFIKCTLYKAFTHISSLSTLLTELSVKAMILPCVPPEIMFNSYLLCSV